VIWQSIVLDFRGNFSIAPRGKSSHIIVYYGMGMPMPTKQGHTVVFEISSSEVTCIHLFASPILQVFLRFPWVCPLINLHLISELGSGQTTYPSVPHKKIRVPKPMVSMLGSLVAGSVHLTWSSSCSQNWQQFPHVGVKYSFTAVGCCCIVLISISRVEQEEIVDHILVNKTCKSLPWIAVRSLTLSF